MENRISLFQRVVEWCHNPACYHWAHNKEYGALDEKSLTIIRDYLRSRYPPNVLCPENLTNEDALKFFGKELECA